MSAKWHRLSVGARTGSVQLSICLALAALFAALLRVPEARPHAGLLLLPIGGVCLVALGHRARFLRDLGIVPLLALLVPSWLVAAGVIPDGSLSTLRAVLKDTNALGLVVTLLVAGSVLGISREMLSKSVWRVLAICIVASAAAGILAVILASVFGFPAREVAFLVLAPVMSGGISAGVLPLADGYAELSAQPVGELLARMLPSVLAGNLFALSIAGAIAFFGRKRGTVSADPAPAGPKAASGPDRWSGPWLVVTGFVVWALSEAVSAIASASGWPASLLVLVLAGAWCCLGWGKRLREAIVDLYRLGLRVLVYPLLFAVGLLLTPWHELVQGFTTPGLLLPIIGAVGGSAAGGMAISRRLGLTHSEGAILALTRAAMGGTGAIAILSAAGRLDLMPQAQILTRLGGSLTLASALAAASVIGL
ncbi:2-hydroxycarboxylate transporter family protein [Enterovirga rhinocerotis]|uniref:Na+/citrate or Na+/malate symporter n=1 Tax=Enterovirga rhinocerotis TaxID=1339210 RepID=A0A4R7C590_9HYPH|nr:2-hydroxycarboxylate transporter family protein [Enterovirga rhinocerotis]TDR93042.1 Na+/citrate or Na+/malate symporter [Enterovirga rhinocerotis]